MTVQARVWWARLAALLGLGWLAFHVVSRPSIDSSAILGRYSPRYFVVVVLVLAGTVAGAVLALGSRLRQIVEIDHYKAKLIVFGAWLPLGFAIYATGFQLAPLTVKLDWNRLYGGLFGAATVLMLLATLDAVRIATTKPEFWLAVAGVVLALGLAEGGLRLWLRSLDEGAQERKLYDPTFIDPSQKRFAQHQYAIYIPRPGLRSADGLDEVNSLGYRGEEIEQPKPDGVYRIVAVGGSTTYGTSVDDWRDAYPAQLETILTEEYGFTSMEVINAGVGGYNSWETLVSLQFRVLDLEPDLIIFYQNPNDVHSRIVSPAIYRGDNSGRRKPWDGKVEQRATSWPLRVPSVLWRLAGVNFKWFDIETISLDSLIAVPCSGPGATETCLGMTPMEALEANPPIYYERNIRNIVAVARANGADVLLLTWAYSLEAAENYLTRSDYQAALDEHNELVGELAGELETYFYDLAATMPDDPVYWTDGRHMTKEGNRLRAELIAAYIAEEGVIP